MPLKSNILPIISSIRSALASQSHAKQSCRVIVRSGVAGFSKVLSEIYRYVHVEYNSVFLANPNARPKAGREAGPKAGQLKRKMSSRLDPMMGSMMDPMIGPAGSYDESQVGLMSGLMMGP